jgi:hypothetical protein
MELNRSSVQLIESQSGDALAGGDHQSMRRTLSRRKRRRREGGEEVWSATVPPRLRADAWQARASGWR